MPKRSASSTTMTVAFGTSTPTSMTVVATSTSSCPARNSPIVASFSSGLDPAVEQRRGGDPSSGPSVSSSKVASAERTSSFSDSSISGHTT